MHALIQAKLSIIREAAEAVEVIHLILISEFFYIFL